MSLLSLFLPRQHSHFWNFHILNTLLNTLKIFIVMEKSEDQVEERRLLKPRARQDSNPKSQGH